MDKWIMDLDPKPSTIDGNEPSVESEHLLNVQRYFSKDQELKTHRVCDKRRLVGRHI